MNFKSRLIFFIFFTGIISYNGFAQDLFKIPPYSLKHTNGRLVLNFQLNMDKELIIEDGENIIASFPYKKDQHYQRELPQNHCGVPKDLKIKDALSNAVVFTKNFTAGPCVEEDGMVSEFTFGFISDTQEFKERHEAVAKLISYHHSIAPLQFIINGGDVVQNGQKELEWIEYFAGGQAYLMDIPQIAAIGNHDYRGNNLGLPKFFKKYMRWEGSAPDGNLFFDMPGLQLVIWNSNVSDLTKEEEKAMWKWLEGKMIAAQRTNTPLILATHFPVYSSSLNRFTSAAVMKLRSLLVPLAERYGVKLILSGHTHMYERSYKEGVHYLVAGPAGGRPNKPSMKNPYQQKFDANALTFTKIKYSRRSLKIDTYNQDNVLIDELFLNL